MRKRRNLYISSTVISVLLHLLFFSTFAISLKTCTAPASITAQPPPIVPESIDAEVITQQEINTYYERKQQEALVKEHALQLERERQERARRLAEEQKQAELLKQKKLQEEQKKQEEARLEQLRTEQQEQQRQAELRRKEQERIEKERLAEEQKRLEEEQKRIAEEKRRLEEEQKRAAAEKRRLEEEKRKQLEEEQRRLAEHRKKEEAERLKMRKKQIAIWQRQYEQMIRNSVEQHWKKPPTSIKGGECILKIRQDQQGAILGVNFIRCEGDKLFVRSVEEAVWKANPFPIPPSADVFASEIEFTFKRDY